MWTPTEFQLDAALEFVLGADWRNLHTPRDYPGVGFLEPFLDLVALVAREFGDRLRAATVSTMKYSEFSYWTWPAPGPNGFQKVASTISPIVLNVKITEEEYIMGNWVLEHAWNKDARLVSSTLGVTFILLAMARIQLKETDELPAFQVVEIERPGTLTKWQPVVDLYTADMYSEAASAADTSSSARNPLIWPVITGAQVQLERAAQDAHDYAKMLRGYGPGEETDEERGTTDVFDPKEGEEEVNQEGDADSQLLSLFP